ncbi:unnamed protein product, partial [Ectocarpus sp. 12 AP-2014]
MSSGGLETEMGDFAVAAESCESDITENKEAPCGTDDSGKERESPHEDDVMSEVASTGHQRKGETEASPGIDSVQVKEEEEDQEEEHEERARPGKRKSGGMAKALVRHSIWTASSQGPTHAESSNQEPPKRQRTTSASGTTELRGGGGAAATHKTASLSTRATTGHNGPGQFCQEDGCTRRRRFGKAGTKKAELCSQHAEPDMVNVVTKPCGHPGCTKKPSYGKSGTKKAEFCSQHAELDMINVVQKTCGHLGCTKRASFGRAGRR